MENQIFFGTIKKNQTSDIKVSLIESDDYTQVDIRQWVVARDDDSFPTKKGIRFDISILDELQDAFAAIARHLQSSKRGNGSNP